jgi:hypothetical protein
MFDFAQANIPVNLSMLHMGLDSAAVFVCYFAGLIVLFFLCNREP